ncbi:MAG: nucleotide sugar dehydrogenase [Phycisphaerales bacterium]
MDPFDELARRIEDRSCVVGVVGLGYVGLPLVATMHAGGLRTLGFDIDPSKIDDLARGRSYLHHIPDAVTLSLAASDRFEATADFDRLCECDAVIVCVPTPLTEDRRPDLSFVESTGEQIGRRLRPGMLVVLESTTFPGTTRREFAGSLARTADAGLELGRDYLVAFSPEREDPGNAQHSTRSIPKLVGGLDDRSTRLAASLYRCAVEEVVPVSSAEVAEAAKILENVYRAVNIALVNEMKMVLDAMGIDVWEVVRAAATKPFGFQAFWPGPGLGGHCIPIDPFYLSWRAREVGQPTRFIELAGEVNHAMPRYVVDRTVGALADRGTPIDRASVLVLGLAYKRDIGDVRESPSFELITQLRSLGAVVAYSDPFVARTWKMRRYDLGLESITLTPERVASYDAVLIATDHAAFDYAMLAGHARLVIDTRDAMRPYTVAMGDRLVRA